MCRLSGVDLENCLLCLAQGVQICTHEVAVCNNATVHQWKVHYYKNSGGISTFHGCGFCKYAKVANLLGPAYSVSDNPGWPGCCFPPQLKQYHRIPPEDWPFVARYHRMSIPDVVQNALNNMNAINGKKRAGSLPMNVTVWEPGSGTISNVEVSVDRRAPERGLYTDVYSGSYKSQRAAFKIVRNPYLWKWDADLDDENVDKRIIDQVQTWRALGHNNILDVHGFLIDRSLSRYKIIVTPWCKNGNLENFMERNPGLEMSKRMALFWGVANGLDYLHSKRNGKVIIVHGDLKPTNVLIDHDYIPKLCDFTLSSLFNDTALADAKTIPYMAPEILSLQPERTTFSDVYAFGCLGLEIMTSVKPYAHTDGINHRECKRLRREIASGLPPAKCPPNSEGIKKKIWVEIFEASWRQVAQDRPSIRKICALLACIREELEALGNFLVERPTIQSERSAMRLLSQESHQKRKGGHTHRFTFMNSSSQVNLRDPTTLFTRDGVSSDATSYYTGYSSAFYSSDSGISDFIGPAIPEDTDLEE